jgi:hypothetical protein
MIVLREPILGDGSNSLKKTTDKNRSANVVRPDRRTARVLLLASALSGCSQTPSLDAEMSNLPYSQRITTTEVVDRVKCELAVSIKDKIPNPTKARAKPTKETEEETNFRWMRKWTVKADLTLSMNEQSSLSPSVAFVRPLKNVFDPGVGPSALGGSTISAVQQSFTFGISGGYTGQAVRSNILTFALSFEELRAWYSEEKCPSATGSDLQAGLDLKRWMDEALAPVQDGDLRLGNHVAPTGVSSAKAPPKAGAVASLAAVTIDQLLKAFSNFDDALPKGHKAADLCSAIFGPIPLTKNEAEDPSFYVSTVRDFVTQSISSAKKAEDSIEQAKLSVTTSKAAMDAAVKVGTQLHQMSEVTEGSFLAKVDDAVKNATQANQNAIRFTEWTLVFAQPAITIARSAKTIEFNKLSDGAAQDEKDSAYLASVSGKMASCSAKMAAAEASKASQNSKAAKASPNPPIDATSQSVDFVVTASANASPSWSLINLKGPGNAGNSFSMNGIRTHTLDIAIGPPGPNGTKTSAAQDNALLALKQVRIVSTLQSLGGQ